MGELSGKVVIVTGGGQGIGFAIVKKFAENGATVIATGRTLSKVEKTAELLKEYDVVPYRMDCGLEQEFLYDRLRGGLGRRYADTLMQGNDIGWHAERLQICRSYRAVYRSLANLLNLSGGVLSACKFAEAIGRCTERSRICRNNIGRCVECLQICRSYRAVY